MKRAVDERVQQLIDRLPEELLEAWEERAAVRQYDGGHSRPHADYRQLALIDHALRNPQSVYRIDRHQSAHHVTYQTARTDLLDLVDLGLLGKSKAGRAFIFIAPEDLRDRLEAIKSGYSQTAPGRS